MPCHLRLPQIPRPPRQAAAAALPALPEWAKVEHYTTWERNASLALNRELVAESNASTTVYDIIFMGARRRLSLEGWVGPCGAMPCACRKHARHYVLLHMCQPAVQKQGSLGHQLLHNRGKH